MRDRYHLHVQCEDEGEREKYGQAPDGDQRQDGRGHLRWRPVGGRVDDDLVPEMEGDANGNTEP